MRATLTYRVDRDYLGITQHVTRLDKHICVTALALEADGYFGNHVASLLRLPIVFDALLLLGMLVVDFVQIIVLESVLIR